MKGTGSMSGSARELDEVSGDQVAERLVGAAISRGGVVKTLVAGMLAGLLRLVAVPARRPRRENGN